MFVCAAGQLEAGPNYGCPLGASVHRPYLLSGLRVHIILQVMKSLVANQNFPKLSAICIQVKAFVACIKDLMDANTSVVIVGPDEMKNALTTLRLASETVSVTYAGFKLMQLIPSQAMPAQRKKLAKGVKQELLEKWHKDSTIAKVMGSELASRLEELIAGQNEVKPIILKEEK